MHGATYSLAMEVLRKLHQTPPMVTFLATQTQEWSNSNRGAQDASREEQWGIGWMNEVLPQEHSQESETRDWRKRASDHVAYALLVYTALQIFVTVHAMKDGSYTLFPYLALIVLVAGIIPACRWFEKRWVNLSDEEGHDPALKGNFKRDMTMLWALAIGLPFILTGIFKLFSAAV